jgi:3-dehydroquinate synthase
MAVVVPVQLSSTQYEVIVGPGALADAGERTASLVAGRRAAIICDATVAALHAAPLQQGLAAAGFSTFVLSVPPGEASKSLAQVGQLAERLADLRLDRECPIIALGGGMVGDLAGFVAATWLRGVPFIHCTTTTEGAIDAAVGGKTAVNLRAGKNLVGAFHQPRLVVIDTETLRTLPPRDFRAGLAEAVKHALIRDAALLDYIEANAAPILEQHDATIVELIRRNVEIKAAVVRDDERETGGRDAIGRAALNFGHTIGHAVEAAAGFELRHGECVAIGLVAALQIGCARGRTDPALRNRTRTLLTSLGLPVTLPGDIDAAALWRFIERDKKAAAGRARFLLLDAPGTLGWADDLSPADVTAALRS